MSIKNKSDLYAEEAKCERPLVVPDLLGFQASAAQILTQSTPVLSI